jgi:hypothetical protein
MQTLEEHNELTSINNLPTEQRVKLVGAFVWLLEQGKKQNPELYKRNQNKND